MLGRLQSGGVRDLRACHIPAEQRHEGAAAAGARRGDLDHAASGKSRLRTVHGALTEIGNSSDAVEDDWP